MGLKWLLMLITHLYIEWYVDRCGSENGYQKTCVHKRLDYVLKIRQPFWVNNIT